MFNDFLKNLGSLYTKRDPFAIAFIVSRQKPSSGKPGDKAIITKEGNILGWIGGGCTKSIVVKEALDAINDGKPRMVKISSNQTGEGKNGVKSYTMTCQSGGSIEVYIEPVLPSPHLLIMGKSQIAMALAKIGKAMNYTVSVVHSNIEKEAFSNVDNLIEESAYDSKIVTPNTYIVVCTQEENDGEILYKAVVSNPHYIAFVASMKKANAIFGELKGKGIKFDQLKDIKTPAGLDINAKTPEEVAISILAQIIADLRGEKVKEALATSDKTSTGTDFFVNPVCNLPIQKSTAKYVIKHEEIDYYFCCDGCKESFEKDSEKYALKKE